MATSPDIATLLRQKQLMSQMPQTTGSLQALQQTPAQANMPTPIQSPTGMSAPDDTQFKGGKSGGAKAALLAGLTGGAGAILPALAANKGIPMGQQGQYQPPAQGPAVAAGQTQPSNPGFGSKLVGFLTGQQPNPVQTNAPSQAMRVQSPAQAQGMLRVDANGNIVAGQ